MRNLKDIILEKLKVTKKSVPDIDEDTIEVPYYEFVIWYTGALGKKPDKIILNDFKIQNRYFKFGIICLFYLHCVSYSNREFIVFAAIYPCKIKTAAISSTYSFRS